MPPVFGRQLVDAGRQPLGVLVGLVLLTGRVLPVVVVQSGGLDRRADLAVGPAPLAQPLLDQPLQRAGLMLLRGRGGARSVVRVSPLVPLRMCSHSQA